MAEIVAYVKILRGEVFAKRSDGSSRQLKLGEPVYANEFISTGKDGYIELAMGNESPFTIPPGEQVLVSTDMRSPANHQEPASGDEAKLASGSELDTILQKIQAGADPTLLLEATAAGGSSGGGHDFVRLLRISEQLPPAELDNTINAAPDREIPFAAGADDENQAPVVPQQDISTDEDTPFSGQIIAADPNGDQVEYVLATPPAHGVVVVSINGIYTYVPNANYHGSDSFVVNVSDGRGGETAITINVTVNSINDIPVAADQTVPTPEDTAVAGAIAATDVDGDTLTYTLSTAAAHGTVTLNADGSYSYQPNANFNGSDSFVVTVSDGHGGTKDVTVTVNVGAVNDAPVAADQTISTDEDTTVTGAIVATDAEGDALTYTLSSAAANGTVTLNADGSYSYQPNANFNGSDSFVVTVSDGHGGTKDVTVTVNVGSVNDSPIAADQTISTDEDTTVTGAIIATDADGDALTYSLSTAAANGTVTLNADGSYSYQPNADFNGSDSFIVTVSDGHGGTKDVTVTVNVGSVNDAPVAADQTIATDEDTTVTGTIVATDADGDALTYSLSTSAANGTVTLNADGSYSYQPNADFNGSDSFVVTVSDGNGGSKDVTVTVNVTAVNDVPIAADQTISTNEDTTVTGAIIATDVDGDALTYSLSTAAANGTVTLNADGSYSYQPNADFNGSDSFVVTVSDGNGGTKDVTVTVNVGAVNDVPVAADQTILTDEDTTVTGAIVATDAEGDALTYTLSSAAANGTVTLNADGSYSYQPNANFNGSDSFVVTVSDGHGGTKDVTVTVNVGSVNDSPIAADQTISTDEDTTVTGAIIATDADGDALTYSLSTAAANGTVTLNADGSYSYQPNADFNGSDSFIVTVSDGHGGTKDVTVTVNVGSVNDAPVAADQTIATDEDTTVTGAIIATDADGDALTYSLNTAAANGTVTLNADGSYSYQPNANFNGSDSFVVTVSDGNGGSKDVTVTVNVTAVNDVPVAADQTISTDEDTTVTGAIVATDVDGDTLTYSLSTAAANGTVTLNADGSYSYQPNADFNGSDSFVVTVSDDNGGSKDVTVTVNVAAINDAPVGNDLSVSTDEDTVLTGTLTGSDADNDTLSYSLATSANHGTVVVNADGSYSFTPNADFNGSDSFTVTVSDGHGGTDTLTVNVTVNPVADAAQIGGIDSGTLVEDDSVSVASGTLTISDADGSSEEAFNPQTISNAFGTFTLAADGNWSFTLDNSGAAVQGLAQGENSVQTFTVTSVDGTSHAVTITVTGSNDAAVIGGSSSGVVTEDSQLTATGSLSISDIDGSNEESFTAGTYTGSFGSLVLDASGNWTYSLTANSTLAVQALDDSESITDSITVTSADGTSQVISISINGSNDAPTVTPVTLADLAEDGSLTISAADLLAGASDVDGDALSITAVSLASGSGTLVDNGNGTWTFTPAANFNGSVSFSYTVSDGTASVNGTASLTVTAENDAPIAADQTISTDEDTAVTGAIIATDADGDALTYSLGTAAANGTVTLNADGSYSYQPNADFNGSDSFVVTVSDGNGGTKDVTVTVNVGAVNDAPTAADQTISTDEDTTVIGAIVATDADGDALTYSLSTAAANGTVTLNVDGSYSYQPNADFNGSDSFVVTVSDGNGGTKDVTVTVNVGAVNDAPVAADQTISTDEDTTVTGAIVATDADGDALTYSLSTAATNGSVTLNADGSYSYQPNADFNGSDSFVVTVNDGNGGSKDVTVTVNVGAVNDAPVAADQTIATDEDTTVTGAIVATDVDGDTLTYSLGTAAANGTVTLNADGSYSYQPNTDFNGNDSFVVTVSDGNGGSKDVTVTVNVGAVNDVPVAADQTISTDEDTTVTGAIVASDAEGDALTYSLSTAAANGTVTLNADGSYSYQPNTDFNGNDSFVVTVSDGNGGTKDVTVTVNVAAINDAPVAADVNVSTDEDSTLTGSLAASDVDNDTLSYALATGAAHGTVVVNADGTYAFTPNANFNGNDSFTVTVSDGHGGTDTFTVNVTVNPVNDAPVGVDTSITTNEDTVVTGTLLATDVENDALSFALATGPAHGSVTVNADGTYAFTPNANFNGSDSFTVTVNDGHGGSDVITVNVAVTPVNDAPTATAVNLGAVLEDSGAFTITAANLLAGANDVDGDPLTITSLTLAGGVVGGTLVNNGNGTWTFTPAANFNGNVSFNYTVSDGSASASSTAALTVTSVNDAPGFTGLATSVTYTESSAATITRTIIDSNVVITDGDSPNFAGGSLTVNITNAVANQDLLGISNQGTGVGQISVSGSNVLYNFGSGAVIIGTFIGGTAGAPLVVSFNSAATAAAVDALVQRINYGNSSQLPDTTARIITFTINDGDGTANGGSDSTTRTVTVNVVSTNDVPAFAGLSGTRTHVEGGAAVVLDNNATISDRELAINNNYGGSTLTLSRNGGANASDVFSGTGTLTLSSGNVVLAGVTIGSYDTTAYANGQLVITFNNGVTNAQVNGVLQRLAYSNSSDNPPASVGIGFVFSDGNAGAQGAGGARTTTGTITVNITGVNDAPVGVDQTVSTDEDTSVSGNLGATDPENNPLTFTLATGPGHGSVVVNADGSYTYTPSSNYFGNDSFIVTVSDGRGGTDTITVNVTVNPVTEPALIGGTDSGALAEDVGLATASGTLTISDADGSTEEAFNPQTISNAFGTFTLDSNGHWSFALDNSSPAVQGLAAGENSLQTFTVTSIDGTSHVVTVTISGSNDAAVITGGGSVVVTEDAQLTATGMLLINDADNAQSAFIAGTSNGSFGSLTLDANGNWTYTLTANSTLAVQALDDSESITDSVTVSSVDGTTHVITITINGTNDAPDISPVTLASIAEDGSLIISATELLAGASDVDGDALSITSLTLATGSGTLIDNGNGSWTFTPAADFNGDVAFSYSVSDGTATSSSTASLTVSAQSDAPVASSVTLSDINEDGSLIITAADLLAGASDVDGDSLSVTALTLATGNGTLIDNGNGTWTFTPAANFNGTVSLDYTVSDGANSASSTASLNVAAVNDAPLATPVTLSDVAEDGSLIISAADLLAGASDVDGNPLSITALSLASGSGTLIDNGNGTWTFTPSADFNGSVSFNYTVSDGSASSNSTASLTVTASADAAQIAGVDTGAVAEDSGSHVASGTLTISDADGSSEEAFNPQTISNAFGTFTLATDGNWSFTLDNAGSAVQGLAQGENSVQTFTVNSVDGTSHAVTITVTGSNDAAVIGGSSSGVVTEDSQLTATGSLSISDIDGSNEESFTAGTYTGSFGSLVLDASGNWTYSLTANSTLAVQALDDSESITDSITITSADGTSQVISISINGSNDAPTVTPVTLADLAEDGSITISAADLLAGASDVDGDALSITAVSLASGSGTLVDNGNGSWTFTPAANFNGSVSFSYTVSDGSAASSSTASLNVTAVNDAPIATPVTLAAMAEDGSRLITAAELLAGSSDVDFDSLSITALSLASGSGTLVDNGNGTWTFTPAANFNGSVSFNYTVSDGSASSSSTASLSVTPVNDAPVASNDSASVNEDGSITVNVLANDSDIDGGALSVTHAVAGNGIVVINADSSITYLPNSNYNGSDTITYVISDGNGGTSTATVTVNVTPVNDAPVATPVTLTAVAEDGSRLITAAELLSGASDVDGTPLSITALSLASGSGTLINNGNGTWTFTPSANFNGNVSFNYTVSDGSLTSSSTASLNVTAVNDAPTANNQTLNTAEDTTVASAIVASDVDGDALSYSLTGNAAHGTVTLNSNGSYSYQPATNFSGTDSFIVTVSDGHGGSKDVTVNVNISSVVDTPTLTVPASVFSLVPGTGQISTTGAQTQAQLETSLGLSAGTLDGFNPAGSDPGTVDVFDGQLTNYVYNLNSGNNVSFSWNFTNGENTQSEINSGYNDLVVLIVTAPDGTRQSILISSSEQAGAGLNTSGAYNFAATQTGTYQFSWLVLNGVDGNKDSTLNITDVNFVSGGNNYAQAVPITLYAALGDTDGSESMQVTVSGVPTNALFSAGTNLGSGVWSFTAAQLAGLYLLPADNFTGNINLHVTATATDIATGTTSSVAQDIVVTVASTSNNILGTSGADSITAPGNNSDLINSFTGDDTINAGNGNDLVYGGDGVDTINGGNGNDSLYGQAGNDILRGDAGDDRLVGGTGSDSLTGGTGADVFVWQLGDQGTGAAPVDTVTDFSSAQGDVLDLSSLLQGETQGTLSQYLHFSTDGAGNTRIEVWTDGNHSHSANQIIDLTGVDLTANGTLSDTDIINQMLLQGRLRVDGGP
ncbi:tandem-95 repeat protein [Permianibacter sp. IMCC34836]|uniref:tandem-95 repeat protein n=1 Tax=Permianibacter fluminis TaxID=2738515 RepID=UPI001554B64E|nr:Ig-like domain-containing protein [Permianibacter fluminis]NQD38888.1 tandem-95 repeat protein [Permianibacter fluminis]